VDGSDTVLTTCEGHATWLEDYGQEDPCVRVVASSETEDAT
jgi:hypothetical protein